MNYVNNWSRPIELAAGAMTCPLDLPDGKYRLCISDTAGGLLEVVDATVIDGTADLVRGQEGTSASAWPAGSQIFCSITAGLVMDLYQQIKALEQRVSNLEPPAPEPGQWPAPTIASYGPLQFTLTTEQRGSDSIGFMAGNYGVMDPNSFEVGGGQLTMRLLDTELNAFLWDASVARGATAALFESVELGSIQAPINTRVPLAAGFAVDQTYSMQVTYQVPVSQPGLFGLTFQAEDLSGYVGFTQAVAGGEIYLDWSLSQGLYISLPGTFESLVIGGDIGPVTISPDIDGRNFGIAPLPDGQSLEVGANYSITLTVT